MAENHRDCASLVERIHSLEVRFQQLANSHPWICLATKNHEEKKDDHSTPTVPEFGELTAGRWPPMFFPLVSSPNDPHLVPVLDQVQQLTNEACDLLFAALDLPNRLPTKLVTDIRDWDSDDHLLIRGGWLYLLRYVMSSQDRYVFPNYCQVAATALSYLRSKCESIATEPGGPEPKAIELGQSGAVTNQTQAARAEAIECLKEPTPQQIKLYWYALATGKKQIELADDPRVMEILGAKRSQGSISRYLDCVAAWIAAGRMNADQSPLLTSQPSAIDPSRLDLGKRADHRPIRHRPPLNSGDD
jgi:hypothetical protein